MQTNAEANAALSRATKEANDGLTQLQNNFALAKQMFQDQLMHDLEVSSTKTQSLFEKLVQGMDTAVQSTISKIGLTMRAMESDAGSLSEVSPSGEAGVPPSALHVWLTCGRMSKKPTSIPRTWRRILEESFSRL